MKPAFTILRVSEDDQLKGYGPDVQARDVESYLSQAGLVEVNRKVIQEESTTWNRPQFEAVLDEALAMRRRGKLEAVIFPRRNRLARYGSAGGYYLGLLDKEGLEVHFAREKRKYDPKDSESFDWVMRGLSQAQADADEIRINTSWGRRLRAEQDHRMPSGGRKWAYEYHPYRKGWGLEPNLNSGRYTVKAERAAWVMRWADWILLRGMSINRLSAVMSKQYGIKLDRGSIPDILSDPILIGKVYAYRTKTIRDARGKRRSISVPETDWLLVYEDDSLRILADEQFYALKEKFRLTRENSPRHTKYWYPPLRGLVFCSCGRRMVGIYRNGRPHYRCVTCRTWIRAIPLWEQIRDGIKERLLAPERLIPAIESQLDSGQALGHVEEELRYNSQQLMILDQADEKALRLHLYLPDYPADKLGAEVRRIQEKRSQFEREIYRLERQLDDIRQAMVDKEGLRQFCQMASRNVDALNDDQWRILLETMKVSVLVDGNDTTVKVALPTVKDHSSVIVGTTLQGQLSYLDCPLPSCGY